LVQNNEKGCYSYGNKVTVKDFRDIGARLVSKYNGSMYKLMSSVYPEYEWLPWRFVKSPHNFFVDNKNKRDFLDWAGKKLGIKELDDWYNVSLKVDKSCTCG
jgi:hypothetical protein